MIVRDMDTAAREGRMIKDPGGNWDSTRLLLKDDNMGFSFHITTIYAGADFRMHYQNHLESVYCMSGEGEVETLADGKVYPIAPGTLYILDKHDEHKLRATTEMKMACVFNPPLHGTEVHNAEGAYELHAERVGA
ncbi:MAG TPA: ectoine synthase [Halieaceae bacterium]|jgi:L-ectoine synthase|nr:MULTISPECIES: ectoine synthase [Haliea]MCR9187053.1 ectoine synthase [Halieaceae bacterium]MAY93557.1 ectoine synthase [Haliea sp.]MBK41316.1 ectoine synthase [Haliea sp.]MBP71873.1 ectoine synthase [Haliea sp.]HAN68527.1 ectoine synthase [Halieaceae bacterium]